MSNQRLPYTLPTAGRARLAMWRWCITLFAALSLLSISSTVHAHGHKAALVKDSCAVCSLVQLQTPTPKADARVTSVQRVLHYLPNTIVCSQVVPVQPLFLPPSCGPPVLA
ncbi:hypothetical protein KSF73_12480 [Burkholderiaceae bacterium DAT-1]|nr:hypothetical protein [Burkholderiaceae bacterium DAT-1]